MNKYRILWVEDQGKTKIYGLVRPMINEGHDVSIAESTDEAQEYLDSIKFDALIMDLSIPRNHKNMKHSDMDYGFDLMENILKVKKYPAEKIIVLSAHADENDCKNRILEFGIPEDNIMTKGIILPSELKRNVYRIIETNR